MSDQDMYLTLLIATHHTKPETIAVRLAIQLVLSELRNRAAAQRGVTDQEMQDSTERMADVAVGCGL